ncbi:hypothetical protein CAPN002_00220 [Capnocytophaga stomatis]|uniref:hypothetical protein n=1 Tax=Capnocytophaga stomatis TaxID=1848904 RepID=UPI00194FEB7D|nr:hypothetical protein [Capnocytophaga stomatis]GIJ92804.1 hypothetical protein CAPN002_00220 [Capnocytophaga stomatis]
METNEETINALLVKATVSNELGYCFIFNLFTWLIFYMFCIVSVVISIKSFDKLNRLNRKNINIPKEQFTSVVFLILAIVFLAMSVMDWCKILNRV